MKKTIFTIIAIASFLMLFAECDNIAVFALTKAIAVYGLYYSSKRLGLC